MKVVSGDVSLAVHEWGDSRSPTIVLVHGYPDTSAVWTPVAERLASRFHVVAYDVRGAGASGRPPHRADYRLDRLLEDLRRVIDATSPDRPVHLVGHDWGSIQGWEAVTDPALAPRIASYTSLFAPGLDHAGSWIRSRVTHPTPRHLGQLANQALRSWYVAAFHLPGAGLMWRVGAPMFRRFQEQLEGVAPANDYPAPSLASDAAAGVQLYRANFAERVRRPAPRTTDVPTQVIICTRDKYVSGALAEGLELTASRLWRTRVAAGHWVLRTHPDAVARWVSELVDHVTDPAASPPRRLVRATAPPGRLDGSVAVVTGAGSGIGRATSLALAARGATVVGVDINEEAAAETASLARRAGGIAEHRAADVSDGHHMEALAKGIVHDLGVPDIVVNNAGIGMVGPVLATTVDDWARVLDVNLWGVIHGSRLFAPYLVERAEGGHIVNVASAAAFLPSRTYAAYATSKAACLMLTESLRAELASSGVTVTAVCPGLVDTPIATSTRYVGVDDAEQDRRRRAASRLYRLRGLRPEVVADAIVDAIASGAPVVPVGVEARAGRLLSRLAPGLVRALARVDATPR